MQTLVIVLIALVVVFFATAVTFIILHFTSKSESKEPPAPAPDPKFIPQKFTNLTAEWMFGTKNVVDNTVTTPKEFIVSNNGTGYPLFTKPSKDNELQETVCLPPGGYTFTNSQGQNGYETIITAMDLLVYSEKDNSLLHTIKLAENVAVNSNPAGSWNSDMDVKIELTESAYILPKLTTAANPAPTEDLLGGMRVAMEASKPILSTKEEIITLKYTNIGNTLLEVKTSNNLKIELAKWAGNAGNVETPLLPTGLYTVTYSDLKNLQNGQSISEIILATNVKLEGNIVTDRTKLVTLWGNKIGDRYDTTTAPLPPWLSVYKFNTMVNIFTLTEPSYVQILKYNNNTLQNYSANPELTYEVILNRKELQ